MRQCNAQPVLVIVDAHPRMFVEQPRQMATAGPGELCKSAQRPGVGRIGRNRVLHPMNGRVYMVASFQPRRQLRIVASSTQINHEIARDRRRAGVIGQCTNDVKHQVDARGNPGT